MRQAGQAAGQHEDALLFSGERVLRTGFAQGYADRMELELSRLGYEKLKGCIAQKTDGAQKHGSGPN